MNRLWYSKFLAGLGTGVIFLSLLGNSARAAAGDTTRVSVASDGTQGNGGSAGPQISSDGRYVAFYSAADNLVSGDTNGKYDVFLRDTQLGTTLLISVDSNGIQGDNDSLSPSISANGRYVAFFSAANNLVSGDTNGKDDVFLRDTQLGTTTRISVNSSGIQGNKDSDDFEISISADGHYVAFASGADNLVNGDTNGVGDVFLRDIQLGITTRVSVDSSGGQGNGASGFPSISADGRYVAFISFAKNLVIGDLNNQEDIFMHDTQLGTTQRISVSSNGTEGNEPSLGPSISGDGRYVAFYSNAFNLVNGDMNGTDDDVFVYDTRLRTTTLVSVDSSGIQGNDMSDYESISADGRYVAFRSDADNLVSGDMNNQMDVFLRDIQLGITTRISVDSNGIQADNYSGLSSISANGRYVVFGSTADNLVSGDTNGYTDVFMHENDISSWAISGNILDANSNVIAGVNISDNAGNNTTTDRSGNYILSGETSGTYTITPSKDGYTFSPPSQAVTVPPDALGQNFTGNIINGAKPWLIMYYLNGDNSLNDVQSWVLQELEKRQGNPSYNIAVMFDGKPNNDSRFYYIGDNISFTVKNELNSGDPATLTEFINWARDMFPTQYSALIISDHGNLTGISEDDSQNRTIQLNELETALQQASIHSGNIDVLFTEACLMGNIEASYQVKDYIDYYVSSEQEIWMGTPPNFLEEITSTTSPEDLAIILAENYNQARSNTPHTISVAQMSMVTDLANDVSNLADQIKTQMNSLAGTLLKAQVLSAVQRFDSDGSGKIDLLDESIDLYSFSRLIYDNTNDVNMKSSAQAVMNSIQDDPNPANRFIVYNSYKSGQIPESYQFAGNTWSLDDSHGVSIFFSRDDSKRSFYSGGLVSFATGTDWNLGPLSSPNLSQDIIQWGPMLVSYEETIKPNVTDDPNPPILQAPLNAPYVYIYLPLITR